MDTCNKIRILLLVKVKMINMNVGYQKNVWYLLYLRLSSILFLSEKKCFLMNYYCIWIVIDSTNNGFLSRSLFSYLPYPIAGFPMHIGNVAKHKSSPSHFSEERILEGTVHNVRWRPSASMEESSLGFKAYMISMKSHLCISGSIYGSFYVSPLSCLS